MRKVASSCGVSATAIYRHFEDKEALLAALLVESFRRFQVFLSDSDRPRTPLARFRRIAQRYFDFSQQCPHDYRLIFMTDGDVLGFERLDATQAREVGGTFETLVTRIKECQDAGLFRQEDPRLVGAYVWSAFHGLASLLLTGSLGVSNTEAQDIANYQVAQVERSLLVHETTNSRIRIRIRARPLGAVAQVPCPPNQKN